MDVCFIVDEASAKQLETSLHGCHCLPEWSVDGTVYKGCSTTDHNGIEDEAHWCRVIEDVSTCPDSLGPDWATSGGAGRGVGRWDWCTSTAPSPTWRPPESRFTAKEPNTPSWYNQFLIDQ